MWTIPNILTLVRLAALPATLALFHRAAYGWAGTLFVAAMATDCFDGWIARRFNQSTTLGLYLDPVVDKIVVLVMLYDLSFHDLFHPAIPHLFLAREFLHSGIRSAAAAQGRVVGSNWMGKVKAVLQNTILTWALLLPGVEPVVSRASAQHLTLALAVLTWGTLAMSWIFFAVFAGRNRRVFRQDSP